MDLSVPMKMLGERKAEKSSGCCLHRVILCAQVLPCLRIVRMERDEWVRFEAEDQRLYHKRMTERTPHMRSRVHWRVVRSFVQIWEQTNR